MSLKNFGKAALIVAVVAACGKNRVQVTDNGLKYQIHEQSEGTRKGKVGDILTLHLTLMNNKDSILRDTHKEGAPFQMLLQVPPFKGSYEEGLAMLGKGDSATFYVSADSLFTRAMQPLPPGVQKGSDIGIAVKVLNIQTEDEYKKQQAADFDKQKGIDAKVIDSYVAKNGLAGKGQKTQSGVYYIVTQPSSGPAPKAGEIVKVRYTGKLLNGTIFDSSEKSLNPQASGEPVQFPIGVGQVIPGWEEGVMKMHKGEKATLIIPSTLAYGSRANPKIPANSVLLFDIELLDIQKGQQPGMQPGMPQPSR
ncbi:MULTISPECIES: FKBP-type peptidyl-prolyl cis-trans isomerase [unclassified Spirosoma]|uniref:FKBP-type peptidyl-prolyl cis-trans isomerase n=1 Tax=unclassified Spirosoma TaxID=2621999 RepID=UPI000960B947|nr:MULTISPECIES: FKBP-type peptidyl-prolyl cis-trans isomerase [unclassified Spirosoma]MBN8824682.1 FKBP-type peptidyl-prolyl cis-trans isomerase [Spirosoma sp.]OJW78772.1 MAG: peptidylprolyl isomerase [Spirosoma sp. 48-14]